MYLERGLKINQPKGRFAPLENFEKLDPKSCILRVSASVQIFSKNQVFLPGQTKHLGQIV
jgi:hypothetical protein